MTDAAREALEVLTRLRATGVARRNAADVLRRELARQVPALPAVHPDDDELIGIAAELRRAYRAWVEAPPTTSGDAAETRVQAHISLVRLEQQLVDVARRGWRTRP